MPAPVYGELCHALQNPLFVLQSTLDALERSATDDSTILYKIMRKSIADISTRIQELLESPAFIAEQDTAPAETFTLGTHVFEIIEYVRTVAQEHSIQIYVCVEEHVMFFGNKRRIEELLTNLLSNSIRHTKDASIRRITVAVRQTVLGTTLLVKDTGSGITSEHLPHVFQRSYSTNTSGRKGHGLGLSIAKKIVEEHGGLISIMSPGMNGTFVSIRFPHRQ
jgi:signal transduction histidine kinase